MDGWGGGRRQDTKRKDVERSERQPSNRLRSLENKLPSIDSVTHLHAKAFLQGGGGQIRAKMETRHQPHPHPPPGTDLTLLQGALVNMFLPFFAAVFEKSFSSPTFVFFPEMTQSVES